MTDFLENIVLCHSDGQVMSYRLRVLKYTRKRKITSMIGATCFYDPETRRPLDDDSYFISNKTVIAEFPQQITPDEFNARMGSYDMWVRQKIGENLSAYHRLRKTGMVKNDEWVAFIDGVLVGRNMRKMTLYNRIDKTRKEHQGGIMLVVKVPEERGKFKQL